MKLGLFISLAIAGTVGAFQPASKVSVPKNKFVSSSSPEPLDAEIVSDSSSSDVPQLTAEEKEQIGNLVANEEWSGLSMELTEVIATAVIEDLKKNSRDFLGKDDYSVGDFSKEIDKRVKDEVAKMREKDDYEVRAHYFSFMNNKEIQKWKNKLSHRLHYYIIPYF